MAPAPNIAERASRVNVAAAPLVIFLPDGLTLGGVTTWAVRLARTLARGCGGVLRRRVTIVSHTGTTGFADASDGIDYIELSGLPSLREAAGDLGPFIPAYRAMIEGLSTLHGTPCVVCPSSLGDAYGIAAAVSMTQPEIIRVVGWQHSDIAYDTQVLTHYEPVLSAIVGVSTHITDRLRRRMPWRTSDIAWVPYGVEMEDQHGADGSFTRREQGATLGTRQRPLRLIYTGRLEHEQKRIGALLQLPAQLAALNIASQLTLVGDGPASAKADAACHNCPEGGAYTIQRISAVGSRRVVELLDDADAFVLASRYEGLSVSMLEAMSRGCVPVVTSVESGSRDAVEHGQNGLLVDVSPGDSDVDVARTMARGIADSLRLRGQMGRMSVAARRVAYERFSIERHAALVSELCDRAASAPPRTWPATRACAFTSNGANHHGSGSVPADGAARLIAVLRSIASRACGESERGIPRVFLHGAGRHTIELASVWGASPVPIAGVADDDPAKWGTRVLGWEVCSPETAASGGATDIVISSWLHADAVYARRKMYEARGVRVHHLYR